MGVKGLTTFVDQHRFLTETLNLQDTRLVVDGYSLLYHLYMTAELDMQHGGENLAFYGVCRTFVTNLKKCGIELFILMDGAIDPDRKKFNTIKGRHKDRVQMSLTLAKDGHGIVLPFLAVDVFHQALTDHEVHFAQCDFEADNQISALANAYRCPVLSNDSDFYATDLTGGFINLKYFNYRYLQHNANSKGRGSISLKCKIYHFEKLCMHFKLKKSLLPLLGTLQGNDYIDNFLGKKLKDLIHWLAAFDMPKDVIEASLSFKHHKNRDTLRSEIEASMAMYIVSKESEYPLYFQTKEIHQDQCHLWQNHDLPLWFVTEFRNSILPADSLNVLLNKKCFMANFIESVHHVSANKTSLPLRQIIYGLILKDSCSKNHVIEEYDREGSTVKCRQVLPSYCSISIHNIRDLDKAQSKQFLLDCLLLNPESLQNIKRELHVPVASMIYWIKNAKPGVCWRHILALLIGFLISIAIKKFHNEQIQSGSREESSNMIQQKFKKLELQFVPRDDFFDVDASNTFSQWQSIFKYISYLNRFLSSPLPLFDVSVMFNGPFIHRFYNFLKTFKKPEKALEYIFQTSVLENEYHVLPFLYSSVMQHTASNMKCDGQMKPTGTKKGPACGGNAKLKASNPGCSHNTNENRPGVGKASENHESHRCSRGSAANTHRSASSGRGISGVSQKKLRDSNDEKEPGGLEQNLLTQMALLEVMKNDMAVLVTGCAGGVRGSGGSRKESERKGRRSGGIVRGSSGTKRGSGGSRRGSSREKGSRGNGRGFNNGEKGSGGSGSSGGEKGTAGSGRKFSDGKKGCEGSGRGSSSDKKGCEGSGSGSSSDKKGCEGSGSGSSSDKKGCEGSGRGSSSDKKGCEGSGSGSSSDKKGCEGSGRGSSSDKNETAGSGSGSSGGRSRSGGSGRGFTHGGRGSGGRGRGFIGGGRGSGGGRR